jgi:hypothetical protein
MKLSNYIHVILNYLKLTFYNSKSSDTLNTTYIHYLVTISQRKSVSQNFITWTGRVFGTLLQLMSHALPHNLAWRSCISTSPYQKPQLQMCRYYVKHVACPISTASTKI